MSIYFSKKTMLPSFTPEEIQKQVEKGRLGAFTREHVAKVRGREFAKTKAGKQPPKKKKPRSAARKPRVKKKKLVAQILEKKTDLHGNTIVKVKNAEGIIQTVTLHKGANKPRGVKAKGQTPRWNMKPAKFKKQKGIRDMAEMVKEPKRQSFHDRYKSEMEEARIRNRIAQAGNVRDKELALVRGTAEREKTELRLRAETRAATITELERKNAGLTASHNVSVRKQSRATILGGDVGELNKLIARRGKSAIRQLIIKGEITDMSTLVQLDLEDRDLRDLQRTLEKETSSFTTGKTYFYRTGKGEMKSGKYVGETGGKVIMETPDGDRKGVPRGQMIDPDLVQQEEVRDARKYAELVEAETRSRAASAAPSPRRRSRPPPSMPAQQREEIHSEMARVEQMAQMRSELAAMDTTSVPMMMGGAEASPAVIRRGATTFAEHQREAQQRGGGGDEEAAGLALGGGAFEGEEYAYAGGTSALPTPRETALREEIAAETEPAALLALHQSAAIAERERSATPTPVQTPRQKAFERIALERAGQPQPEPEPTGLELEFAEGGFGQSNWTPTITRKDAFLRRGHYIEGTLPQDSMFFVDNRRETHTEEGRPMIWGSKDELEQRIRDADISDAKQRKALSGLQKGMIKNRSYWSNDKQILKALGFQ